MSKSAKPSKKSGTKRAGPKAMGEDDVLILDGADKRQRSIKSSAPRWSLAQLKGFTVNPYSKGAKNLVDIVVHNSGIPTEHGQPDIKLALSGKSIEIE